jgi:hypothetical protein
VATLAMLMRPFPLSGRRLRAVEATGRSGRAARARLGRVSATVWSVTGNIRGLALGLGYKLMLAPLLLLLPLVLAGSPPAESWKIGLLEAAMPPMIGAAFIASPYARAERPGRRG